MNVVTEAIYAVDPGYYEVARSGDEQGRPAIGQIHTKIQKNPFQIMHCISGRVDVSSPATASCISGRDGIIVIVIEHIFFVQHLRGHERSSSLTARVRNKLTNEKNKRTATGSSGKAS